VAGHAAIDEAEFLSGKEKNVSGMGVCVKKTVAETLFKYGICPIGDYLSSFLRAQTFGVYRGERTSLNLFQSQDTTG
jgi:hypothetical protein